MTFRNAEESHAHSLQTLNMFYEYDDFMESVRSVIDIGCGNGLDLEWWATRNTRDDAPVPLNIRCTGVDLFDQFPMAKQHRNIRYQQIDFESDIAFNPELPYDVIWCHDSFQYAVNPIDTLKKWRKIVSKDSMLVLAVPQTTNFEQRQSNFYQNSGCYYHYTLVSLIHLLALTGWDCRLGFFKKSPTDTWLHAVVYNSDQEARDPKKTTWYNLAESGLLPESADISIARNGYLKQTDLILPWLDKSLTWYGRQ
jgi:SAM-dependent methyltransferase